MTKNIKNINFKDFQKFEDFVNYIIENDIDTIVHEDVKYYFSDLDQIWANFKIDEKK